MTFVQPEGTGFATAPATEAAPRRSGRVVELARQIDQLMGRMRIAVIFGGDKSAEGAVINPTYNPRSWKSYQAVAEDIGNALRQIGFRHVHILPEDMQLGTRLREQGIHMAWLNTGGVQGHNPLAHAAGMLEMMGLPYVGHDPLTAGMLDNKHVFKRELKALGIPTAEFIVCHYGSGDFRFETSTRFQRLFGRYTGPFIVKPVCGRASLNVTFVERLDELDDAVAEVFAKTEHHVLIERFLPGREFCIAACGLVTAHGGRLTRHAEPFVFAAVERLFAPDEKIFTSMDIRPITPERFEILDPEDGGEEFRGLQSLAREVVQELNLESIIRLDIRTDNEGRMVVLEANPKPDLKAPGPDRTSLVCANLADYDMSYEDLILSLFADRLDLLLSQKRRSVGHLTSLLEAS